jgi:hypothetical protein
MSIRHIGKSVGDGSSPSAAPILYRTFYFSEGSEGASMNENVIWYVAGASTNDNYPYVYQATSEFTAELRFQNDYTISSVDDVVLSSDFGSADYEWQVVKSLNEDGNILTLTFTPDENDFNGESVEISIDENNTVLITPGEVYDQYDPMAGPAAVNSHKYVDRLVTGTGYSVTVSNTPNIAGVDNSGVNSAYGTMRKYDRIPSNQIAPHSYYHSQCSFSATTSGMPSIGEYLFSGNSPVSTTGESDGYLFLYDDNVVSASNSNFIEGDLFYIKNILRFEADPNGYFYVAEILNEFYYEPVTPQDIQPFTLETKGSGLGLNFDWMTFNGNTWAAAWDANSITVHQYATNGLGSLVDYAKVLHLSFDGGTTWYDYVIDNYTGNVITIEGIFNKFLSTSTLGKITFAPVDGELVMDVISWATSFMAANTSSDGDSISTWNHLLNGSTARWKTTGSDSYESGLVGPSFRMKNESDDDWGYEYELKSLGDTNVQLYPSNFGSQISGQYHRQIFTGQDWQGTANLPADGPVDGLTHLGDFTAYYVFRGEWRINGGHEFTVGQSVMVKDQDSENYSPATVTSVTSPTAFRLTSAYVYQTHPQTYMNLEIYAL